MSPDALTVMARAGPPPVLPPDDGGGTSVPRVEDQLAGPQQGFLAGQGRLAGAFVLAGGGLQPLALDVDVLDIQVAVAAAVAAVVLVADLDLFRIDALGEAEDEVLPLPGLVRRLDRHALAELGPIDPQAEDRRTLVAVAGSADDDVGGRTPG